mmetsp:Transcript_6219/g.9035  ORF Transcript_6219/g.9035 Transcript_6219/m.9035 type:complete len:140 (+) Transcript_6219:614-1033(+)
MRVLALDENRHENVTFQNEINTRFSCIENLLKQVLNAVEQPTTPTLAPPSAPPAMSQTPVLSQTPHTVNLSTNQMTPHNNLNQNQSPSPDYLGGIPNNYHLFANIDKNITKPSAQIPNSSRMNPITSSTSTANNYSKSS